MKTKLLVLFLEYEMEEYTGAFEKLQHLVGKLPFCEPLYLVVDNTHEDQEPTRSGDSIRLGGDNSCREFSGWQKGLRWAESQNIPFDLLLVCNNSFVRNENELFHRLSWQMLTRLRFSHAALGRVDSLQEDMNVLGYEFSDWICTNCFVLSRKALVDIDKQFVTVDAEGLHSFLPAGFKEYKKKLTQMRVGQEHFDGNHFQCSTILPAGRTFDCQVQVDKVFVPAQHGMGDDNRELGVIIRGVQLEGELLDLEKLSKGGYGVENNTLWMGKTVNLTLVPKKDGEFLLQGYIQKEIFDTVYQGELNVTLFEVQGIFEEKAPLSKKYQMYILDWLTHNWHSKYQITADNWQTTREKVGCLLNEVLLSARLRKAGVQIWDTKR